MSVPSNQEEERIIIHIDIDMTMVIEFSQRHENNHTASEVPTWILRRMNRSTSKSRPKLTLHALTR